MHLWTIARLFRTLFFLGATMDTVQFDELMRLLSSGAICVLFALGYLGGVVE